jgi:hypothetical protein
MRDPAWSGFELYECVIKPFMNAGVGEFKGQFRVEWIVPGWQGVGRRGAFDAR